jgi:hypothetical protein
MVTSCEEVHGSGFKVVHCSRNLYRPYRFEIAQYRALSPNGCRRQLHILLCHSIHESRVLRRTITPKSCRLDGRANLREQPRKITQLDHVDSPFDGAARGVSHHKHDLRSSHLAGELHAVQDCFSLGQGTPQVWEPNNYAAGLAFCELRITKSSTIQPSTPDQHSMTVPIDYGLTGYVWDANANRTTVMGLVGSRMHSVWADRSPS